MNISFEGQVALVTGAGSGLGLATAKAFAESGASVVLADWNEDSVRSAVDDLTARGHKALAIRCDVASEDCSPRRATIHAFCRQTISAARSNGSCCPESD